MLKIGFITCADLSRYFVSQKNALFTHDDQIAVDFLQARDCQVEPVIWGSDVATIAEQKFDVLVVRSPWDYMDSTLHRQGFIGWLQELHAHQVRVANNFEIVQWNIDKHYLCDVEKFDVKIVPTVFLEPESSLEPLLIAGERWQQIVVKPCISAAAKDTFLIRDKAELQAFLPKFSQLRHQRSFMVQPFVEEISSEGEWSLVFINQEYSHAVLKKPKAGHWLVQDELGGSVSCLDAPAEVRDFALDAFAKLTSFVQHQFGPQAFLLYGRVDVLPGNFLGELELVEPELFFLDRRGYQAHQAALEKFYKGIWRICHESSKSRVGDFGDVFTAGK